MSVTFDLLTHFTTKLHTKILKRSGKVVRVHAMKTCWGSRCVCGFTWRLMVNFISWLLYPCGKNPLVSNQQEAGRTPVLVGTFCRRENSLGPLRNQNTVIPRLTKMIRSGIIRQPKRDFPQVSIENLLIRSGCCPLFKDVL